MPWVEQSFFSNSQIPLFCILPVYYFPNLFHLVQANILVVNVVCVFPNINSLVNQKLLSKGVNPAGANIY